MIDRLIQVNLRAAQAFDNALRAGGGIEKIVRQASEKLLTATNAADRSKIIDQMAERLKAHAETGVLPAARLKGVSAANSIIAKSPGPKSPVDPLKRSLAKGELEARIKERSEIVGEQIDAEANRLKARLNKFWREPGESKAGKADRLRETYSAQEKRRKEYEAKLKQFYEGETKTRPGKPNLDFMSDFVSVVKTEVRSQARRIGTDAELLTFRTSGYDYFIWITPNGHDACPDCQKRQAAVLTLAEWEVLGRPGSGMTVCGDNCFCTLLPVETMKVSPSLAKRGDDFGRSDGPMTTAAQTAIFNGNRYKS
jgi:hypothetical protein